MLIKSQLNPLSRQPPEGYSDELHIEYTSRRETRTSVEVFGRGWMLAHAQVPRDHGVNDSCVGMVSELV